MIEALFELVLELILQVVGEFLVAMGWESVGHAFRRERVANPVLAVLGCAIIGAVSGAVSLLIIPGRLTPRSRVPGLSLVTAPVIIGILMKMLGDWRRSRGKETTALATFWGGSMFALAFSLVRFLWLARHGG